MYGVKIFAKTNSLVPMRWRIELDLDGLFGFLDVVPFAKRVPSRRNYLYEDFSLGDGRYFHCAVLVRFQVEFGKLVVVVNERAAFLVKADIDAGVANWFSRVIEYAEVEFRHRRAGRFVVLRTDRT
jgi:hypothetical protein